jgi:putative ABC transport system substrate-binding protein
VSGEAPPYSQVVAGFKGALAAAGATVEVSVESLHGSANDGRPAGARFSTDQSRLVLALGNAANEAVAQSPRHPPVVAGMILRAPASSPAREVTGVSLEFPAEVELGWIRRVLPGRNRVALLFSPTENADRAREARSAAARLGMNLVPIEVEAPSGIPAALDRAARESDVLWGLTDSVVFFPESAKGLLLFSFRNRIPLVGISGNWVRAGALFGLDRDYEDIGRQAGEMALAILGGTEAKRVPPAPPRKVCPVFNLKTARQMGIELPEDVLRSACEVVR